MIDQLESAEPLRARGLAMAERILTNADGSPLYNRAGPGALEWEINAATAAMSRPDRSQSHEFRVGV
jgi:hypothetical protein